ncbi:unnamed protein product [Cuscuta epithymum]|uniref:LYR motif containing domain-containing protein n=1 Tax=Cuscuta epithymum TaxID=186058 RepID=A0AAV0G195_9ASTE|nr:unnamed protein product [Cuscuta epithymum]
MGIIWATTEELARNRGKVLSLYRQMLRSLNSPSLRLSWLQKKAEAQSIFLLGADERSRHNIEDLIDAAEHTLSLLKKGNSQNTSKSKIMYCEMVRTNDCFIFRWNMFFMLKISFLSD